MTKAQHTPIRSMDNAIDIFEYISMPGKGIERHLVIVEGKIGTIPHSDILRALKCHDDLLEALKNAWENLSGYEKGSSIGLKIKAAISKAEGGDTCQQK